MQELVADLMLDSCVRLDRSWLFHRRECLVNGLASLDVLDLFELS